MDPEKHEHLLWIAEEALTAQLPENWEQGVSDDGTPYHFNTKTNESMWEHPLDEHYRQLFESELKKHEEQQNERRKKKRAQEKEKLGQKRQRKGARTIYRLAAEKAAKRKRRKSKT